LENLFTVSDWLNVQRPQEDDEDASNDAAQTLDQISLGQQHSAVGAKVRFDLDLPAQAVDDLPLHEGILLPEWHYRKEDFLPDHCRLVPMLSRDAREQNIPEHLRGLVRQVRHQFKQWRSEPLRQHRQLDGNEIDIQAWVEQTSQPTHDSALAVYTDRPKVRKSRSTLLLADVSQSTESYVNNRPIIDGIRDSLLVFAEGLDAINEPFSLYAFSSIRRRQVRFHLLKNAREPWSDLTRGRVLALKPGYYTRMGAAIRQSTTVLLDAEQEQRWLLILTDGKPNDVDHYEHRYGIEDTRKAVLEAKEKGIQVFAITLDPEADEYAPHLFGRENYHLVTRNENLVELLPRLFRQLSV
ncbi:MAG: VWA domain-containing protein, partial [Reinekea sp.]|nr:VWA domain-containing protein [Reinekea sp.]